MAEMTAAERVQANLRFDRKVQTARGWTDEILDDNPTGDEIEDAIATTVAAQGFAPEEVEDATQRVREWAYRGR